MWQFLWKIIIPIHFHIPAEIAKTKNYHSAEDQNFAYDDYELDLSEKFIKTILQQVDILCETIENGDPSLERRVEVNRNLNDSVNCYKDILISKNVKEEIVVDLQPENYKSDSEDNVLKQEFEDETFTQDNVIQGMEIPKIAFKIHKFFFNFQGYFLDGLSELLERRHRILFRTWIKSNLCFDMLLVRADNVS